MRQPNSKNPPAPPTSETNSNYFFTILERLDEGKEVPKKIVSVARKNLKNLLKITEKIS